MEEYLCDTKNDKSENIDEEKNIGCLDDTSPEDMKEDVNDKENYKSENNDEEKELGYLDDTYPDKIEEGICYLKTTIVIIMTRKNNLDY